MENYTEEQMMKIRNEGFASGLKHATMSEESKKMFERMDEKIDKVGKDLGNKIDNLCDKIHSLEITVARIPESIRKEGDLRYAEKETEKFVKDIQGWYARTSLAIIGLLITIVAVLIYAVINGAKIIN